MGHKLVRLIDKSPSSFATPEADDFVADAARNFRLRPGEDAFSFWALPAEQTTKKQVLAAIAGRRPDQRRLYYVEVPQTVFDHVGASPELDPDEETFSCVKDYHYSAVIDDVDEFLGALREELLDAPMLYSNEYTKATIPALLKDADLTCRRPDSSRGYEVERLSEWALDKLER